MSLWENVMAQVQFSSFWLAESRDALYNAGGTPYRRDWTGGSSSYVGSEIDVLVKWAVDRHSAFMAGYSHFFRGGFIEDTGPHSDIDFVFVQYQFTF